MTFTGPVDFKPKMISALRHYSLSKFKADLTAGIVVGIVALPLAIAFGIASGVSPSIGLITAIIGGFLVSAMGGCSVQIGGPTGAFIVIVYGIIAQFGLEGLAVATFMAGLILIFMGVFRMGTVIKFIPYPIVVGFTAGIALTIFSTQINDFLGLGLKDLPAAFIPKWGAYFRNFSAIDWQTTAVGVISLLIIILMPKISKRIPGALVSIIVMTFAAWLLSRLMPGFHVDTIGDRFGSMSTDIPQPHGFELNMDTINRLLQPAFTIAILGAIESLLSATVADGITGSRTNTNTELIGQGIANAVVPFFGGIPVTGAIARTMTNITNGGRWSDPCRCASAYIPFRDAADQSCADGMPCSCSYHGKLQYERMANGESHFQKSQERHFRSGRHIPAHSSIRPHHSHRDRSAAGYHPVPAPCHGEYADTRLLRAARRCRRNRSYDP